MDLSTSYLGLRLQNPVVCGASPLGDSLDTVKRLEDAGVAAIVMRSLFEEQITRDQMGALDHVHGHEGLSAEAQSYLPATDAFALGPQEYLEQVRRVRAAVGIPVIGSLNGSTPGGWLEYAHLIEEAGAHALELNLYVLPSDPEEPGAAVERRSLDTVAAVVSGVKVPVAVKLSPFYSSLPYFVRQLESAGAKGAVLFNRFYQADIDPEALAVVRTLHLSDSQVLLLRLRWLAMIAGRTKLSLAASGGVHTAFDAVKALMAGASAVQMVSALLCHGPDHARVVVGGLKTWLEDHEYESVRQMVGSMSLAKCPDPTAFERGNYMTLLQSFHP